MPKCGKYHTKSKVNMPTCRKFHAKWKVNMPKCGKYYTKGKLNMPTCSKSHAKWKVNMPKCGKYHAKMTNSSSKPLQTLGKWYQPRNPKKIPNLLKKEFLKLFHTPFGPLTTLDVQLSRTSQHDATRASILDLKIGKHLTCGTFDVGQNQTRARLFSLWSNS